MSLSDVHRPLEFPYLRNPKSQDKPAMKNVFLKFDVVNTIIAAIGIFYLILIVSVVWKTVNTHSAIRTIDGDGKGYYMYLPSIFINGDFGHEPADYRYLIETPNGVINRYNAGTPLLLTPFFGAACIYYDIQNVPYTGYESGFQKMVSLGAWFYFMLALFALSRFLRSFQFKFHTIAITILLISLGTNLLVYTVNAPAFSHVYSFFSISFLLVFAKRFITGHKTKHLVLASVFLGLTLLIRPFNGLIILAFPFLASNGSEFAEAVKSLIKRPLRFFLCTILVMGIFAIQQALWFVQTGNIVLYGYSNEGFYFDSPRIPDVLFSFRKGLFVYTPILLVSLIGLIALFKKNRFRFYSYVTFTIVIVYFISSWWIWYFGPAFGHRAFIDFYPLLFMPLPFLIESLQSRFSKYAFIGIAAGCIALNLLQSYQFKTEILDQSDMNRAKYAYVFGKTDPQYRNVLGGVDDIKPYHQNEKVIFNAGEDFENTKTPFQFSKLAFDSLSHSTVADYRNVEYNVVVEIPIDSTFVNGRDAFMEVELDLLELQPFSLDDPALIVFDLRDSMGAPYYYVATPLKDVPVFKPNSWQHFKYSILVPIRNNTDKLSVYIWNKPKGEFYIDNVSVRVSIFE